MQYYTYKEEHKIHILPMVVIHNHKNQIDLELAWFKFGVFIIVYTK